MTNTRTHGFDSPAQLREHWAELEESALENDQPHATEAGGIQQQLSELRREIATQRAMLVKAKKDVRFPSQRSGAWRWVAGGTVAILAVLALLRRR